VYRYASFYDDRVMDYIFKQPKRVTFQDLLRYDPRTKNKRAGMTERDLIESAALVHESLPIRIARRIYDMNNLPFGIMINPHMQQVYNYYVDAFNRLIEFPKITSPELERKFTTFLPELLDGSKMVLPTLAKAAKEINVHFGMDKLKGFLDMMLMSRISRRLLAEQHVAIHRQFYSPVPGDQENIGLLSIQCDPVQIATNTFQQAQRICRKHYGCAPRLEFHNPKPTTPFPYIPTHLEYILIELFKNSVRATAENTPFEKRYEALPPVQVSIFSGTDEVTIKVSDSGGGINPDKLSQVWEYAFTTVNHEEQTPEGLSAFVNDVKPMAGEGFGLPMARVYARYFGGDLTMHSVHRHGTEVYVRLKHLDPEHLPATLPMTDPDAPEH